MDRYHNIAGHLRLDPNGTLTSYADAQREVEALQQRVRELDGDVNTLNQLLRDKGLGQGEIDSMAATLDATTPAPNTSIIGKCEPPSQWDPNAQVRGDIS